MIQADRIFWAGRAGRRGIFCVRDNEGEGGLDSLLIPETSCINPVSLSGGFVECSSVQ